MKKALLVGINLYPKNQLNGCVNDVLLLNKIIHDKYEFRIDNSTDVRMLTDESATTQNIIDRLNWLVEGVKPGDVLLYHFSGHGVQIPVVDYENNQEPDFLSEAHCPVDFDWRRNIIKDTDYRKIFANVPKGVNLTVISDSCHSGDVIRSEIVNPLIQPSPSPNKPRTIMPPPDIMNRGYGKSLISRAREIKNRYDEQVGILISGCRSDQTSADAWIQKTKKYHGALTYYFSVVLSETDYNISYSDLIMNVRKKLIEEGYNQEPQLDCSSELKTKKFLQSFSENP